MDNVRMGSGISGGMQAVHGAVSKANRNGDREARRERFSHALGQKKKPQQEVKKMEAGAAAGAGDAETTSESRARAIDNSATVGHKIDLLA